MAIATATTNKEKAVKWGKLIGLTGGAQILIQGVGFLCGIYIIRVLSTEQYAYYTLANTMLGTMTVLADGGITAGVMSEGGKVWQDRKKLGAVLATGMQMRRQFAIGSLLISVPILYYLLTLRGLLWWEATALIVCLAPAFWAALSGSLLQIVPKLHQDINKLLGINVGINVVRLILTLPLLAFAPFAALAIVATGASQVGGNMRLRKLSLKKADWKSEPEAEYRKRIFATVRRVLPGSIYYCLSSQITIWLVSIFNDTEGLAQIGALSRLMMALSIVKLSFAVLITPRYARLPSVRSLVVKRFFQMLGLLFLIAGGIVGAVYLFPNIFLWLLGEQYMDLEQEVFLMTISSCLIMISGIANGMNSGRAIIPRPLPFIGTVVLAQIVALAFIVDYTTVVGIIHFSIFAAVVTLTYRIIHFLFYTSRHLPAAPPSTPE